jgi:hypothetical protein
VYTEKFEWQLVGKEFELASLDREAMALIQEAKEVAPKGFLKSSDKVLPRRKTDGRCRICGKNEPLTQEHIPPRKSGNAGRIAKHTLDNWLIANDVTELGRGKVQQKGIYGYTLCDKCNSNTGALYGGEYQHWRKLAQHLIWTFPPPLLLDRQPTTLGNLLTFGSRNDPVFPGAFVRQVLSCMCSASGAWDLASQYPVLRRILLDQSVEKLPEDLELGMSIFLGPNARVCGPILELDMQLKAWRWVIEVAFPPFAFLMVIASNNRPSGRGFIMNDWSQLGPKVPVVVEGVFEIGFGWSPYPGDYRTSAAISGF